MFRSVNPATGDEIATHPELSGPEVEARVAKAAATFRHWRETPIADRAALLERLAEQYDANSEKLAMMAVREMGKTHKSALAEVQKCAGAFRYYAQNGAALLEPTIMETAAGGTAEVRYLPLGPVLAIMPWNYPYWQAVRFLAPTILAGNVALLKHASLVQGVAGLMEEMMIAAGAPDGLFQNLAIKSDKVAALVADPRIVAVTLTGSEAAGRAVAEQAGRALKKVVLELGGSDPFIVMPSADIDVAVEQAVVARIQNSGQSCVCGKRMIVHAAVYDAFRAKFSAAMQAVKAGDPTDPATDMGPLSSIEQRDTVLAQLHRAKAEGAKLLFGGEPLPGKGAYVSAGILVDVPLESDLMAEEIFGPVAMLFKAADIDDAIRIANAIPYGLGSSVWTNDSAEQERFVRDIEAGMTAINKVLASTPEAPFGGIKASGHGRELGPYGLHEFMNLKTVMRAG
ncbi:MAG: NAD-dependent succinate-semialdehyde dehydrogenase [Sandarakinorhabdus sp.]|nr:NAD-dependent succinate-semialdehyde dehydrogenase [Sandarakinorhabdus sp.]